jgi:hypothetical protein
MILAKPQNNLIYTLELPRLSVKILEQLKDIKAHPSKINLDRFQVLLRGVLFTSMWRVADDAFIKGVIDVEREPYNFKIENILLRREIFAQANQASKWIADTTGTALDIVANMSKNRVASNARADLIGVNNLAIAFFRGTRFGWGLDKRSRKRWELSDGHDKDDLCDDNFDEGPIGIDEVFQSGDSEPPAHIECNCFISLTRSPWPE